MSAVKVREPPKINNQKIHRNPEIDLVCSLKNFQDYLQFKEHSAENLLFWNWYKRYRMKFYSLPENERSLSPNPVSTTTPTSPDMIRIPKLIISGTHETTGGDFSPRLTMVVCPLISILIFDSPIFHRCKQLGRQFNRYEPK